MNLYNRDQLACIEILESFHINPHAMSVHGASTEGYTEFIINAESGEVVIAGDTVLTVWRLWPKGFPVDTFLEHLERWRGSM